MKLIERESVGGLLCDDCFEPVGDGIMMGEDYAYVTLCRQCVAKAARLIGLTLDDLKPQPDEPGVTP